MAKMNARGAREVTSVQIERDTEPIYGSAYRLRERWALRSDGWILTRRVREAVLAEDGTAGEWRKVSSDHWAQWRRMAEGKRTAEAFTGLITRLADVKGWRIVSAEDEAAERRASVAAGVAKRKANAGPDGTDADWQRLTLRAHKSGEAAADAVVPVPMVVQQHANPLDDRSPVVWQSDPIMDGPCGFAYVTVYPGNGPFARWAKRHGWHAAYRGGIQRGVSAYGQSVTRKEAYASAYAAVLRDAGLRAYSSSRLD